MARKKKEDKKEEFDIEGAFSKVDTFLVEGLKKYIFENGLVIETQKEFDELLKKYGGF